MKEKTNCRRRGFKSIRSTVFATASSLVLVAIVIVVAFSLRYTQNSIYENSSLYTQTIVRQMNQNIDSYITYMENIASIISESEDAQGFLFGEEDIAEHRKRLVEQFGIIINGREDIRNIGIVRKDGRVLFNDGTQEKNENLDLSTQQWYQSAISSGKNSVVTSSHVQHVIKNERPWVITLSRSIEDGIGDSKEKGVVFIDLNYSAISELCDQNSIGEKSYIYILNQDGNIVYHPQQQQLYNELQTENIDIVLDADPQGEPVISGSGNDSRVYTFAKSEKTGWMVVGCMNMNELTRSSRQGQFIYVMTAVILIIIALLFSNHISRAISRPIQKLRDSMAKVQEGDFSATVMEVPEQNEIGSLTRSFNVMIHQIEELMKQNRIEQEQKRKSELKALQSQINPHFLYNTLDSIIWMAEGKKNEEVVLMTSSLAKFLRQSISNEDQQVSIGQEVEYARSYLTIQKMRYKNKLEYEIYLEASIKSCQIVKLVLQPIIENAIYHGIKYKEGMGMVTVRGYEKDGCVVLEVADNGVGMDEETLKHIFERHKVNYRSNGVGVYNVQKRLKLYYGNDYGITYESEKGMGTKAVITIPKVQEGSHEKV
ncbi:MAG: sensor histidine kinase [Blautia sp.]|nr:sensor histidine kinase [Blautia sp.]